MFKNVASQKIILFAFDYSTGAPKTGDSANITAYVSKDDGTVTVLGDTSATEIDSTNAKGSYSFDLTQAETNADKLYFSGESSTSNVAIVPLTIFTVPANFTKLVIDSSGLADANTVKLGPSGSGTTQTGRDIGASVLLSSGTGTGQLDFTSGVVKSNLVQILATALTETAGQLAAGFKKLFNVAAPTFDLTSVNQTGDSFARIGSTGSGLSSLAPASTALSNVQWTNSRAAYLDNLNVGGAVASQADVAAINLSATKHLTLASVQQYERPESGSTSYPIECRTYDAATGALTDADSTPTLTATGQTSGDLSANLSAATHVSTGIYRWTYSVANDATNEPLRFDVSATISSSTFTLAHFSQVVDDVSVTWNATNASQLAALYNKAPAGNIADEALLEAAIALTQQAGSAVTLPSIPTNWIDAAGIAASALNGKGDWSVAGDAMTLANGAITTAAVADGAITDAKFTVPTEPSGLASGVLSQLNQLWRRFVGNKITQTSTKIEMYKSDGTTVVVTQAVSDDGTTQTQGAGS